jgi:glyoxylate reductase
MSKFKVLVTRRIPDSGLKILTETCDLDIFEGEAPISRDVLLKRIKGKDGLLCLLSDRIDKEIVAAGGRSLKVISNYAVGYNNIDVEEATKSGVLVTNTPGVLTDATADLTWALLLACARRIPKSDRFVRDGRFVGWGPTLLLGREVYGKTLGIIGMGEIGAAVARRAKGFGMKTIYHNRKRDPEAEKELDAMYVSVDDLLRNSDYVSLHVPLTPETHYLIGEKEFAMMKPTAILLNASRGEVIDEKALIKALKERRIDSAGLDVYEKEPRLSPGLAELDNVVLTPHTGSATYESRDRMAVMAAENLVAGLRGERPPNLVNVSVWKD